MTPAPGDATILPMPLPDTPATRQSVDQINSSPIAWVLTGLLVLVAAYFLIRMIEWDLMNRHAENQEDPLDR